eukprot:gnl/MRDRNA2_/MRDRNA2_261033_c0_seq1.p1 gnl/MRDRNA2_/MRDRNA2_261033_c0~~gnl/MRDRNA2_/MRDRNA2_261033_c0_seq1.p1  ORF type:complete len:102 (-),score=15.63 gnl/MRDRNA2_/MRDRNA2_261033_c0_seq1:267-539(-)
MSRPGDPISVCEAIENFGDIVLGFSSKSWLKVAGGAKAQVLTQALGKAPPNGTILEIGTYCGYSSIRSVITNPGCQIVTLEVQPVYAAIA